MKQIHSPKKFLFGKKNYQILFIAFLVISIGFVLMIGGGSDDPSYFNEEIFSFRRIRLAPTTVLIGFIIAMYSIFRKPSLKK